MGYLLIAALLAGAAISWRSPRHDSRFLAVASLVLASVIAVQMWWSL
jgi:hypothetical protein